MNTVKRTAKALSLAAIQTKLMIGTAVASVYDGTGLQGGLDSSINPAGTANLDIRTAIVNVLAIILNFVAFIAVIMVIIAGLYLILSFGNEENKDKAKRIIFYTLIGLAVILFARVIVGLVTVILATNV